MEHILEMRGISKYYGSLLANDSVDLTLSRGEILAVVGENGAGKTTLMKILYGLEKASAGTMTLSGSPLSPRNPRDAINHGIGMVQQHFMLFPDFTVAENIVFGTEPRKGHFMFDRGAAAKTVENLCSKYSLQIDPRQTVRSCSVGLQQRVEILKILNQDADIIILDEPSAVLTPQEVDELMRTIRRLAALGKSFILITHKLREVMQVSDRVMVMRQGKVVGEMPTLETDIDRLSFLMVGRQLTEERNSPRTASARVLEVKDLRMKDLRGRQAMDGISLHVDAGEIVGIAGVSGNGQSELVQCITGLSRADAGTITLLDKALALGDTGAVRNSGCSHIPEDRYVYGCAAGATLAETTIMGRQRGARFSRFGVLKLRTIGEYAQGLLWKYGVMFSGLAQKAEELSGGNLQKLIVAREIELETPLIVAAEPTRGVDVGAMEFIHGKLRLKRDTGGSVLLVSSELSEILSLSDRIYTIYNGRLNAEFDRKDATEEKLGLFMMGGGNA